MKSFENRKIMLYPFTDQTYGLASLLLNQNVDIIPAVSSGSSYIGKSIGYAVNRIDDRAFVNDVTVIDEVLIDCIFLSGQTNFELHQENIEFICKKCFSKGIDIIYKGVDKKIQEMIELYCKPNHFSKAKQTNIEIDILRDNEDCSFVDIDSPVIYVGGLIESGDSFENALNIKNAFEELGYSVLLVSKNRDAELIGGCPFPEFFMTNQYVPEDQMSKMVKWFRAVININNADVIVVDLPKGMLTYNKRINNSYGIYSIMLSLIIKPDFLVVSINNYELSEYDLVKYSKFFEKTIGIGVDVFHMSNRYYKVYDADYSLPDKPLYIKQDMFIEIIKTLNSHSTIKVKDLTSIDSVNEMRDKIIEKFSKGEE